MNDTVNNGSIASLLSESLPDTRQREATAFDQMAAACDSLVLFGAGGLGHKTLIGLRQEGIEPIACADNNPGLWGRSLEGVPVLSPQDAAQRFGASAVFVITIWKAGKGHRMTHVIAQLESLGCKTVIPFTLLYWKYPKHFLPDFCLDLPSNILKEKENISGAYNLLSDDLSRSEYLAQLEWRLYSDWSKLSDPIAAEQYFAEDIYAPAGQETFIDCGAFDGDTLKAFLKRREASFKKYIAFEPDPQNFTALENCIASLDENLQKRVECYPYAVGEAREKVWFESTGGVDARVKEDGIWQVDSFPLDESLAHVRPTFIKMDIEGSEIEALVGAKQVIGENHPVLAICVYHKPHDLWSIPLQIKRLYDGYHFFLRPHLDEGWDLVCYAVPSERLTKTHRDGAIDEAGMATEWNRQM